MKLGFFRGVKAGMSNFDWYEVLVKEIPIGLESAFNGRDVKVWFLKWVFK